MNQEHLTMVIDHVAAELGVPPSQVVISIDHEAEWTVAARIPDGKRLQPCTIRGSGRIVAEAATELFKRHAAHLELERQDRERAEHRRHLRKTADRKKVFG